MKHKSRFGTWFPSRFSSTGAGFLNAKPFLRHMKLETLAAMTLAAGMNLPAVGGDLEYFAFSGSCATETYIQETAQFTNLCLISLQDPRLADQDWVTKMIVRNMQVVVGTHDTFFIRDSPDGPFQLRDDYQEQWRKDIEGKGLALGALAPLFYVADEPNWTGISRDEIATGHEEIKASFPEAATITSFNYFLDAAWFEGQQIPTDLVGYHQYAVRNPTTDPLYQSNVDLIKSFAIEKKIIYILDAWWTQNLHGAKSLTHEDMAEVANNYYAMALKDPDAIGLIGFHWETFGNVTGARNLPESVQYEYRKIGSEITGKCLAPKLVKPEHALFMRGCEYYATLQYFDEGLHFATAMPRENDYGTWVKEEGNVIGGLKLDLYEEKIRAYPAFYDNTSMKIKLYHVETNELVWQRGDRFPRQRPAKIPPAQ